MNIMHRDLKSANVFLNKDGTGKLGDLNVSKVAEKGLSYTQTGTPYYASPEVWRDEPYDVKSDIWSLGCVLYEMIALKPPFRADNMQGLYKKVLKGQYPKISHKFSIDIQTIVRILLQVLPKKRPTCQEILNHAIVKSKISELFPDETNSESDGDEEFKNQLLKTIYLPKGTMNIAYLTDKLPKPTYDIEFRGAYTERQSYDEKSNKSVVFPSIKKKVSNKKAQNNKSYRKLQDENDQTNSIQSYLKDKTKLDQYNAGLSISPDRKSRERSIVGDKAKIEMPKIDKLAPMERLANKIEEAKNDKPEMNIDREYKELREILSNQQISNFKILTLYRPR
jgi:NIMA (never in mitosis gene a)-related kinase 1/4/5